MKQNIFVLGSKGQLGSEFVKYGPQIEPNINWFFFDRKDLEFNKLKSIDFASLIEKFNPSLVINCAAYTKVDNAEKEKDLAIQINATAVGLIAEILSNKLIPFIHFSTDYVFGDSSNKFLKTHDKKVPISMYGKSKLIGEELILKKINSRYKKVFILRVSWVFGEKGNNFVKTILKLSKNKETINVVSDQYGGPTSAASIAKFIIELIPFMLSNKSPVSNLNNSFPWGIHHFQNGPVINWSGFAEKIINSMFDKGIIYKKTAINKINTSQYKSLAERQLNSRLDCTKTKSLFKTTIPKWENELEELLDSLN